MASHSHIFGTVFVALVCFDLITAGSNTTEMGTNKTPPEHSATTPTSPSPNCSEPPNVKNGTIDEAKTNGTTYLSFTTYKCLDGFDQTGHTNITCNADGNWSQPQLQCTITDCSTPPKVKNGTIDEAKTNGTTYLSFTTYKCLDGFDQTGHTNITCNADGNWSLPQLQCTIKDCSEPPKVKNGTIDEAKSNGTTYLSFTTYKCLDGFDQTGHTNITCNADGNWSQPQLQCTIKDCSTPPKVKNGTIDEAKTNGTTYLSFTTYKCLDGFDQTGHTNITCNADGNWSLPQLQCTIKDCSEPPKVKNGTIDEAKTNGTTYLSFTTYKCLDGFDQTGHTNITCNADGNWSQPQLQCTIKDCSTPPKVKNGTIDEAKTNGTTYLSFTTYKCLDGFDQTGHTNITCNADGNWSLPQLQCTIKDCSEPPKVKNGTIDEAKTNGTTYLSFTTYKCLDGFDQTGHTSITCNADGNWSQPQLQCTIKDCSEPPNVKNGTIDEAKTNGTTYLSFTTYKCLDGFDQTGHTSITCNADGNWSQPQLQCTIKDCSEPPNVKNGTIDKAKTNGTTYLSFTTYKCLDGFDQTGHTRITCNVDGKWSQPQIHCTLKVVEFNESCDEKGPNEQCSETTLRSTCINGFCGCDEVKFYYKNNECKERPTLPNVTLSITNVQEKGFSLRWGSIQEDVTVNLLINPPDKFEREIFTVKGNQSFVFKTLQSGTFYIVTFYLTKDDVPSYDKLNSSTYTVPEKPSNATIQNIREKRFDLIIPAEVNRLCEKYNLTIFFPLSNENNTFIVERKENTTTFSFENLTGALNYTVTIYSIAGDLQSIQSLNVMSFTRPPKIASASISQQQNTSLNVHMNYTGKGDVKYCIKMQPPYQEEVLRNRTSICECCSDLKETVKCADTNMYEIDDLKPGTNYHLRIYSCIGGLISECPYFLNGTTRPSDPNITITRIGKSYLTVQGVILLHNDSTTAILLQIFTNQNELRNVTIKRNESNHYQHTFENLTAGTNYKISAYSNFNEIFSKPPIELHSYTQPGEVASINVNFSSSTENALSVQWKKPLGHSDSFEIDAVCRSPNNITSNITIEKKENKTSTTLPHLDPGTFCNITIVVIIFNVDYQDGQDILRSEEVFEILNISTRESAPSPAKFVSLTTYKDAMQFSWRKPATPNGIIRKYKILVIDEFKGCLQSKTLYTSGTISFPDTPLYSCQGENLTEPKLCQNNFSNTTINTGFVFEQNTSNLHPYRNYSIHIQAFTKCWGEVLKRKNETQISVPSSYPKNITSKNYSSSITLSWDAIDEKEEGNGPIVRYTINTSYFNRECLDGNSEKINITNETTIASITIANLRAYWNYTITISASTKVGEGPSSNEMNYTTSQSNPGPVDSLNISKTETKEANFSWQQPCLPNGDIIMYELHINEVNTTKSSKKTENFTQPEGHVRGLCPYCNYTVAVKAFTIIGPGPLNDEVPFTTKVGFPMMPKQVTANSISNDYSTLLVSWTPPVYTEYTGPTIYNATAIDTHSHYTQNCTTGYDFYASQCRINKLDAYWNYTIKVYAITTAGTNESLAINGTTAASTPGNVTSVQLLPEGDIMKPRMLQVIWNEPLLRDKNGKIIAFHVNCTNIDDGVEHENNTKTCVSCVMTDISPGNCQTEYGVEYKTNSSVLSCVMTDISPGKYQVEVFAETCKGNGSRVSKSTYVQPGVPIKRINETDGRLLMKPSDEQPPDKETQIAIQLPLKDLLCDTSNGDLKRWGVIVAQDDQATDEPFAGSIEAFKAKEAQYKNWFKVKDMDSIPPYIATPKNWTVNCAGVHEGNRRKRDASQLSVNSRFIVGDSGQCKGVKQSDYCNGELQPGRSYRVKSFACTDGGCTETEYSNPLSTVHRKTLVTDPDLTAPIAAGISSAVIVIAAAAVVVFVLRRKQLICFTKDDESLRTHTPGEGINLDKIENKKKNHFRQGPIKLSDFPDAVEKFHKDSDLLFADAYKMLKEKSPSHPMTAAEQQCCRPKNRYTNILPFDHSRVKLRPSDDMEGSDYINANYIPGYTSRREYIATQGPMLATIDDFWRMVWEQNVDTIVMLTKLMEKGRHKCDKYWPDLGEPVFYGDLVVSLQSESNLSDYTIKIFEIKMKEERKMVRHFSYLKWPDMGCPDTPELLLEFVKAVKQYGNCEQKPTSGPTIVHCSAGVGRTGTFIAVDYLLQHIRDHDEVDIFNLVLDMRNHRLNMVQTEDQFIYIHECVKAFITTDEEDDDDEAIYVNTGFGADEEESIYVNA